MQGARCSCKSQTMEREMRTKGMRTRTRRRRRAPPRCDALHRPTSSRDGMVREMDPQILGFLAFLVDPARDVSHVPTTHRERRHIDRISAYCTCNPRCSHSLVLEPEGGLAVLHHRVVLCLSPFPDVVSAVSTGLCSPSRTRSFVSIVSLPPRSPVSLVLHRCAALPRQLPLPDAPPIPLRTTERRAHRAHCALLRHLVEERQGHVRSLTCCSARPAPHPR